MQKQYLVLIGDIVNSKKLAKRGKVQEQLLDALAFINQTYSSDIASRFCITLGDEFQGLLRNPEHALEIIRYIENAMHPVKLRFGMGFGEVSTEIHPDKSSEIDGPAYHRARRMIEEVECEETQNKKAYVQIKFSSGEDEKMSDILFNALLSVSGAIKSKWTDRQNEIIAAYLNNGEKQYPTAAELRIDQPGVSKALKKTEFHTYKKAMEKAAEFMKRLGGEKHV